MNTGTPVSPASRETAAENTPAGGGIEVFAASALFGGLGALLPLGAMRRATSAAVRHPAPVVRTLARLPGGLVTATVGGAPDRVGRDSRFTDRAWQGNPFFRRLAAGYLTTCDAVMTILDDLDTDWRTREQLRQSVDNLLAAAAPTNNPLVNPEVWKEVLDTGGSNFLRGSRYVLDDWRTPSKLPAAVDRSAFRIGETIAATPGAVVRRERLYELLQYTPTTEKVDAVPTVFIASPVNKFYLLDLAPDRSLIRAELRAGRRVFVISWVNPDASHADVGFDDYIAALIEAMETACRIAGTDSCHPIGLCGGGQITLIAAAYLAAVGRQQLMATLSIAIAVTDFSAGPAGSASLDRGRARRAIEKSRRSGRFDAADTARSFAVMRPVDGIWNAFVHRYLLGRAAPKHDLLYWAADQTDLAAAFGADLLEIALDNPFVVPGRARIRDTPIDVSAISVPTYVLGASTDHISPWRDCYRTVAMIGETADFVLATGGHAAAIARGPGAERASYRTSVPALGVDADEWLGRSELHAGPWWDHWNAWLTSVSPDTTTAPAHLGDDAYPVLGDAPGTYVRRVAS
ncbi:poly(3-hydroxyalkanoate) polymerase [Tsukamurella sp. 8F]|uniref:PHA/PHB synthase family protein n=1 Tax=unclassified Tsukamurella TaxID=2633480 RepID=UPI0023BA16E0|nr:MULTISPECIES: alpha/beta fold hydrolase [unclassified Tsukamurella]MDF0529346.1 poly(3-hydroxyalkanoate) polymerase [Tsukamurella sp. 8J]MDF0587147.1 poly(3-hydroxyalkanoate) polymerase [Tsukamurella sp. 8F]